MPVARRTSSRISLGASLALLVVTASCGGGGESTSPIGGGGSVVTQIALSQGATTVTVGQTTTYTAQPKDASGVAVAGQTVTWSSSDQSVATVAGGTVTAIKAGATTITATVGTVFATAVVTVVNVPVASVSVDGATDSLSAGATRQLTATPKDASGAALAGRTVTWSSNDTTVATVSASGLVTGQGGGSATITATSEGKAGSIAVNVRRLPVSTVTVSPDMVYLRLNQTSQLLAVVKDSAGRTLSGRTVGWSSSDNAKVTVSPSGVVTGVSAGTATITATSEGKTGKTTVTVDGSAPVVASFSATPTSLDVSSAAKTVTYSAHVTDAGVGVALFYVKATSSTGPYLECSSGTPQSGTIHDGTFGCSVTVPKGASPGDWKLFVVAIDSASNQQALNDTDLAAAGFTSKFTVTSATPDRTPPTFTSLTASPTSVDVRTGSKTVTGTAHLTDDNSGVARFDFVLVAPDSSTVSCTATAPTTGTVNDGDWSCTLTIPAGSISGDWAVAARATDNATYWREYTPATGYPAGFSAKVTVTGR
jgi:uncharacterized protein YjdB